MAIKIDCNICGKPIKTVRPEDIGTITGKEICNACGVKIDAVFGLIEKEKGVFDQELEGMQKAAKLKYSKLDDIYNNYQNKANDLFLRTRKELESLKTDIIENEMQDLPKRKAETGSQSGTSPSK